MWIAPQVPPEEAPRQRSRPNPFQMPGGGYRACSPAKSTEGRETRASVGTPRLPEGSPAAKPESREARDVPPRLPEGSPASKPEGREARDVPPRLPEGSLRPPRGPPSGHLGNWCTQQAPPRQMCVGSIRRWTNPGTEVDATPSAPFRLKSVHPPKRVQRQGPERPPQGPKGNFSFEVLFRPPHNPSPHFFAKPAPCIGHWQGRRMNAPRRPRASTPRRGPVHVRNGLGPVEDRTSEWEAEGEQ
eukprot:g11397.t1